MKIIGFIFLIIGLILFWGMIAMTLSDKEVENSDGALFACILLLGLGGVNYGVGEIAEKVGEINERERKNRSNPETYSSSTT